MDARIDFPVVDLRELLIPWERCFGAELGPVNADAIRVMKSNRYDYAPVFDRESSGAVLGLVSRARLEELHSQSLPLTPSDGGITRPTIPAQSPMDALLEILKHSEANIVVDAARTADGALGLFTRSDLNRHPFRTQIYFILAHLESELAGLIRRSYDDPWEWLQLLSEDQQARIIGYWEVSKKRGVDNGPESATMLSELLKVAERAEPVRKALGLKSSGLEKARGRIPELRNQIMRPVRPLIVGEESLSQLKAESYSISASAYGASIGNLKGSLWCVEEERAIKRPVRCLPGKDRKPHR